jgi:prevent-host-death family protein
MSHVTLEEARNHLEEVLGRLQPDEEIVITDGGQPVARVTKVGRTTWPCRAGSAAGRIHMAADFDAPIDDFREYTE